MEMACHAVDEGALSLSQESYWYTRLQGQSLHAVLVGRYHRNIGLLKDVEHMPSVGLICGQGCKQERSLVDHVKPRSIENRKHYCIQQGLEEVRSAMRNRSYTGVHAEGDTRR